MDKKEVLNTLKNTYKNLENGDRIKGEKERFIILKFEELFESKNYLEGKISDRIIKALVDMFKELNINFSLLDLECINIFNLLMCKDYANGKITEDEVIAIIEYSTETPKWSSDVYYDDSTRIYGILLKKISGNDSDIDKTAFEKALNTEEKEKIYNRNRDCSLFELEVYDYVSLLLSDNFQNGIISIEHLRLLGMLPNIFAYSKQTAVKYMIKVLISDNYKNGLIKNENLMLFLTPEILNLKSDEHYVSICKLISFLLTSDEYKTGKIIDEDIVRLQNTFINCSADIEKFLNFATLKNYKTGKVSINFLIKFIKFEYDSDELYEVLASDNFYNDLVTEEQINELYSFESDEIYNSDNDIKRDMLLWILKSEAYRDNMIDYDELKRIFSSSEEDDILFLKIMYCILYEIPFLNKLRGKYISVLLRPEVFTYVRGLINDSKKLPYPYDSTSSIKNACLFALPVISDVADRYRKDSFVATKKKSKPA